MRLFSMTLMAHQSANSGIGTCASASATLSYSSMPTSVLSLVSRSSRVSASLRLWTSRTTSATAPTVPSGR